MRAFAMRLVFNSSRAVKFERFPEKGEMFNEACHHILTYIKLFLSFSPVDIMTSKGDNSAKKTIIQLPILASLIVYTTE